MMQTIDSIRRTNELSKVLKQHGFTNDSFDAVSSARSIVGDNSTIYESRAPAPSTQRPHAESQRTDLSSNQNTLATSSSATHEQKIANLERSKHLLASRVDSLQNALDATTEQLKQVIGRLESAESRIRQLRSSDVQAIPQAPSHSQLRTETSQSSVVASSTTQQSQASFAQSASVEPAREPSRGSQKVDASISIENIFYSGSRRK